jgi:general secretion pathway protein M
MKDAFQAWWAVRSPREQRMLLVLAGLLAITLVWLLIVRPVDAALADAQDRHDRAVIALAEARVAADAIAQLQATPAPNLAGAIEGVIAQRTAEAGYPAARITPQGEGRAEITIDAARPQTLFPWIAGLERRDGLIVDRLAVRTNPDATLSVTFTLKARAR